MKSKTRQDCETAVGRFSKIINEKYDESNKENQVFVNCGNAGDANPKGEYSYLFKDKFNLISIDLHAKWGCDIVDDISNSKLPDNFCDIFLMVQVLEHVPNIWEVPKNIHRILKPNSFAIIDIPFNYPWHPEPEFPDLWRLTPQGMEYLFKDLFVPVDKYCTDNNTSYLFYSVK